MEERESHWTVASLEDRVKQGADAAQIADVVVSSWTLIDTILSPIIGQIGTSSLYQRGLFLSGRVCPWLTNQYVSIESPMDLAALKSLLMQQSAAGAAAGGGTFLHLFYALLIGQIGFELTETLLRSVLENNLLENNLRGSSAREISP